MNARRLRASWERLRPCETGSACRNSPAVWRLMTAWWSRSRPILATKPLPSSFTNDTRSAFCPASSGTSRWPRKKIASTLMRSGPPLAGFPSVIVGCFEMLLESVRM